MWDFFHSKYIYLRDLFVPSATLLDKDSTCPPWLNHGVVKMLRKKHKAWIRYKMTRQKSDFLSYIKIRNFATEAVRTTQYSLKII